MKCILIEDEPLARAHLRRLIAAIDQDIDIVAELDSVAKAVNWLRNHQPPILIFLDIKLKDGSAFEIFEQLKVDSFIIFTTAYNQYAIRAFKLNSIDYLLKPIQYKDLKHALAKFYSFSKSKTDPTRQFDVAALLQSLKLRSYKSRFVVRKGDRINSIKVQQIRFFAAEEKVVFLYDRDQNRHIIDYSLNDLLSQLDPHLFFRLNRRYITHFDAIEDVRPHLNGRLWVKLSGCQDQRILISREKVKDFKAWLDR